MKKIAFVSGVFSAVVLITTGCNNSSSGDSGTDTASVKNDTGSTAKTDTGSSTRVEKNPVTLSKDDSTFVMKAANAGMTEVDLGKIAQQNAASDKVKEFGQMMVKDHSAAGDQLKKIATSKNINLTDSLSSDSKKHIADLQKKKGKDFDKAYIKMMVEGHEKVLKEFEDEQSKGADAELKAFAAQTVPTIKGHLDSAKSIKESLK